MRRIVSFVFTSMLLSCLLIPAWSQQTQEFSADKYAAKLTELMKTHLQLTAGQIPRVEDINLRYAKRLEALKAKTIPRRQKLDIMKADDAAKEKELKDVFTEEQFKIYQEKKAEIKKQMKEKMKENRGKA